MDEEKKLIARLAKTCGLSSQWWVFLGSHSVQVKEDAQLQQAIANTNKNIIFIYSNLHLIFFFFIFSYKKLYNIKIIIYQKLGGLWEK